MSVCLLIVDDGREDYLDRCLESAATFLPPMDACVMVSDPEHELGFAGAVQAGWDGVLETGCEWVFHLESDFLFAEVVPVDMMRCCIEASECPNSRTLAQIALKRQAWNERETKAGGLVEADPADFSGRWNGMGDCHWTVHRRFFTTNPSLYRTSLCERGWPQESHSEGVFTHELLAADFEFALWGQPLDAPRCLHIGETRAGTGY